MMSKLERVHSHKQTIYVYLYICQANGEKNLKFNLIKTSISNINKFAQGVYYLIIELSKTNTHA